MGKMDEMAEILAKCAWFDGFSPEECAHIAAELKTRIRAYCAGELLVRLGDVPNSMGVVLKGRARVDFYDEEGNASVIAQMGPSGSFGEAIAFTGEPSIIQVTAVEDARIMWLDADSLISRDVLAAVPGAVDVMANMLRLLSRKNVFLNTKMQMFAQKRLRDRVKMYLIAQANHVDRGIGADMGFTAKRSEMARFLAVDRSALSRELGRLRDEGLIELDGSKIIVRDSAFLEV